MALHDPSVRDIACLCPDGGDRYENTIYADPTIRSGDDSVFTVLADAIFAKDGIQRAP
jgi:hypothetical protein